VSTAMPQPSTSPLDGLVREDVIDALLDQKFSRDVAEAAVQGASGVTFSEIYRSALDWLNLRKNNSHKLTVSLPAKPTKEKLVVQTQTSSSKATGHAPSARICKCGCGEPVPAENRFSYINGHRSRKANGSGGAARAKPRRAVNWLLPPPRCRPRRARSHRSPTQPISGEALARRQAAHRQPLSADRRRGLKAGFMAFAP